MSIHGMSSEKASQVKRGGHLREQVFSNQFSSSSMSTINESVNFSGSSADCIINKENCLFIINKLGAKNGSTSVKGGKTYQIHLGKIPELVDYDTLRIFKSPSLKNPNKLETCFSSIKTKEMQKRALFSHDFWLKYLGKGEILAIDAHGYWHFFLMEDVINLILKQNSVNWRFLPTGRIKGDIFFLNGKKRACFTFECRFTKKQFVLGAHGGETGVKVFFPWLKDHIKNYLRIEKMNV